ncbi:adhesion G-protein coupled receptor G4 [Hyperolius riggenbachi]|uniref:adhesion G-protein coupled receptor G4 n=1 Tax=Hyperolius riggenbachi TaxID=752182 RepID=UPI0035A316A9
MTTASGQDCEIHTDSDEDISSSEDEQACTIVEDGRKDVKSFFKSSASTTKSNKKYKDDQMTSWDFRRYVEPSEYQDDEKFVNKWKDAYLLHATNLQNIVLERSKEEHAKTLKEIETIKSQFPGLVDKSQNVKTLKNIDKKCPVVQDGIKERKLRKFQRVKEDYALKRFFSWQRRARPRAPKRWFWQVSGTAMGTAGTYANIFLAWWEELFIHSDDNLHRVGLRMCSNVINMAFTAEIHPEHIAFLDLVLVIKENKLISKGYHKPTASNALLHEASFHPENVTKTLPSGYVFKSQLTGSIIQSEGSANLNNLLSGHDNLKTVRDVKAIKMKASSTSQHLLKLLLLLVLTILQVESKDSSTMTVADITSAKQSAYRNVTNIPTLLDYTVCMDLYHESNTPLWVAFSYFVEDYSLYIGGNKNLFRISYMEFWYQFDNEISINTWYSMCLIVSSNPKQLRVYINGELVLSGGLKKYSPLKGGGSLALGCNQIRKGGNFITEEGTSIIGDLYYVQMWDYLRSPEELLDCSEGNIISWSNEVKMKSFMNLSSVENLRCADANRPPSTQTTSETTANSPTFPSTTLPDSNFSTEDINVVTTTAPTTVTSRATSPTTPLSEFPVTNPSNQSKKSTTFSTTGSIHESDVIINSSIMLPTRNNASTAGNISLSHVFPPVLTTTFPLPIPPLVNNTTVQQVTSTLGTTSPSFVTGNSPTPTVTTFNTSKTSTLTKPSLPSTSDNHDQTTENPEGHTLTPKDNLTSTRTLPSTTSMFLNGTTYATTTTPTKPSPPVITKTSLGVSTSLSTVDNVTTTILTTQSTSLSKVTQSSASPSGFTNTTTLQTTSIPGPVSTDTHDQTTGNPEGHTLTPKDNLTSSRTLSSTTSMFLNGTTYATTTTPTKPSPPVITKTSLGVSTSSSTVNNVTTTILTTQSTSLSKVTQSSASPSGFTNTTTLQTTSIPGPVSTGNQDQTTRNPEGHITNGIISNNTVPPERNLTSPWTLPSSTPSVLNGTAYATTTTPAKPSSPPAITKTSLGVSTSSSTVNNMTTMIVTTQSTALSKTTRSLSSQSKFTSTAIVETTSTPGPVSIVRFYAVTTSIKIIDKDTVTGNLTSVIQNKVDELLNNSEFSVLEIIMLGDFNSTLIIQANSSEPTESLKEKLTSLLKDRDEEDNINLSVQSVNVLETCPAESTHYKVFTFEWPETNPTETASIPCFTNPDQFATRHCNATTESAEWENPVFSKCNPLPESIEDLDKVPITPENAKYVSERILNITKNATSLPENDIRIILSKVSEIVALGHIDAEDAKIHLDVVNDILTKADQSLSIFTNQILNISEEIGYKMSFSGNDANITAGSMALLVSQVNFSTFDEMYFTVKSYLDGENLEISLENFPDDNAVASIYLPKEIKDQNVPSSSKVQFNFLGSLSLFQGYDSSLYKLNSYVISASVQGAHIQHLNQPVSIRLQHHDKSQHPATCVFWDVTEGNGMGGWSSFGCLAKETNEKYTLCTCNHLTHFGVLLDLSRTSLNPLDDHILSLLTYVGCGIASLFLGVTLVTYGMFKQLRRDYPSQILMNLSLSLLMLNLLFLVNNWLSSFRINGLCISAAALLHYFLLTSFTWMGVEAVHMYFAFVKVFNSYIHKYILKLCIAGWGIPTIVVAAVLIVNVGFYGNVSDNKQYNVPDDNSASFCWIENDTVFYVAVVAYFGVIFLTNISMFIVVLLQIKSLKSTRSRDWKALFLHDIKSTLSLAFLLGLTWGFAFFAWGPVRIAFLYLFAIFNTLQGFFIFVFHCLIKENVRRYWKMYLCCGRCRLDVYSDWSRLSNADNRFHGRIHMTPSDSYESTRSNNTGSTSNASSLSGFYRDEHSGKNYLNGGEIFISSAFPASSDRLTIFPESRRSWAFQGFDTQSYGLK